MVDDKKFMPITQKPNRQVMLIVLDGWGHRADTNHNAIANAKTPFFDSLWAKYPHALVEASGQDVGLPEGQIGNSEVGHMTIGSGTIIDTDLVQITKAFRENTFVTNPAFLELVAHVKKNDSTLHLMGLVSPGGVHSHSAHLEGILRAVKNSGIAKVVIHAFTDGRDTPPQSASKYLAELEALITNVGIGRIATASGRFFAMDRDKNFDRLALAEAAMREGKGRVVSDVLPSEDIATQYKRGVVDEHLEPTVYRDKNGTASTVRLHDGILIWNFRPDRSRMLAQNILKHAEAENLKLLTFTQYENNTKALVAFTKGKIITTIAKEVSQAGLTQVHIAETEKYAHATYFLNGGVEEKYPGEEHVMIESRKDVPTHDLAPKMRAKEIADAALQYIAKGTDFIFVNFANSDMVGHTANKEAIVIAVEEVDLQLSRVIPAVLEAGGVILLTADHGNAETNIDPESGDRHTAHTHNPVPAIITDTSVRMREKGSLADIAPTTLSLLKLPIPKVMTGKSLVF
jgi:2,3-bisphosphoglycerate-independent phosphoglycerate mutase